MASKATEMSEACSAQRRPAPLFALRCANPPVVCPGSGPDKLVLRKNGQGRENAAIKQLRITVQRNVRMSAKRMKFPISFCPLWAVLCLRAQGGFRGFSLVGEFSPQQGRAKRLCGAAV